jgi:hypothetical protein
MRSVKDSGVADLYEEVIHLVDASSEEEAVEQAKHIANRLICEYVAAAGNHVRWEPWMISQPFKMMDELAPGSEVYSRFYDKKDLGKWWPKWHVWSVDEKAETQK